MNEILIKGFINSEIAKTKQDIDNINNKVLGTEIGSQDEYSKYYIMSKSQRGIVAAVLLVYSIGVIYVHHLIRHQ